MAILKFKYPNIMKLATIFLAILILIVSCKRNGSKYPYAINDFSKKLRPYLETIATKGYTAGYNTSEDYIEENATNEELNKLMLLRASFIESCSDCRCLREKKRRAF